MSESRLVYSTDGGDRRRDQGRRRPERPERQLPDDGVVRVFRGKGGKGGKTMTVVRGLPGSRLDELARDLKRLCASGGSVKDGAVEIQGDHREKVAERLRGQGFTVKLAGG